MKKNTMEAILYGGVFILLVILLIISKDIKNRMLQTEDQETVTTEALSGDESIIKNNQGTADEESGIFETEEGYELGDITTELLDGVPETSTDSEDITEPVEETETEEPYDGENNL